MKVLFLTNIPSPYRVDFFNELGNLCDLTVTFEGVYATDRDAKWKSDKIKNFTALFMKGIRINSDSFFCPEIIKIIKQKWDVILVGVYSSPTSMWAIEYMRRKKIPFYIEADGGLISNDSKLKFKIKNRYISSASGWLSSGDMTDKYFAHYGADLSKIYRYPFTSLKSSDLILSQPMSSIKKNHLRQKLGFKEEKIVISVGRFIPLKGFDVLLNASSKLDDNTGVYIVGGEPTQEYLDIIKEYNLKNIHFVSFISKTELREYYLAADVFVLPTRSDVWGLVINEAMSCGLPVVTTDKCIAGMELIEDDKNGYVVPVDNSDKLAEKCKYILEHSDLATSMTENNLKKIKEYTIEKMAERHYFIFNEIMRNGIGDIK